MPAPSSQCAQLHTPSWTGLTALAGSPFLEHLAAALHLQHGTVIINLHGGGRPRPTISNLLGRLLGMSNYATSRGYVPSSTQGKALQQTLQLFRCGCSGAHAWSAWARHGYAVSHCACQTWDPVASSLSPGSVSAGGRQQNWWASTVSSSKAVTSCRLLPAGQLCRRTGGQLLRSRCL